MVIITDALGNVVKSIPENIYQGSNNANSIVLIAPFASNSQVEIAFKTPDGQLHEPQLMTAYKDLPQAYSQFNGWIITIGQALTQLYGQVQMQFRARMSDEQVIASFACSFTVLKGVAPILPATPTQSIYEQILEAMSVLQADIDNGSLESKAILPYDSGFNYSYGAMVYDTATTAIYQSLTDNNKGNALTDADKWQVTNLATVAKVDTDIAKVNTDIAKLDARTTQNEQDIVTLSNAKRQIAGVIEAGSQIETIDGDEVLVFNVKQAELNLNDAIYRFLFKFIDNDGKIDTLKYFAIRDDQNNYIHIQSPVTSANLVAINKMPIAELNRHYDITLLGICAWNFVGVTQSSGGIVKYIHTTTENLGDFAVKADTYTKAEVDTIKTELETKIDDVSSINIRNIDKNAIEATTDNVQSIATDYIVNNLGRQPKDYDGLFITLTDQKNDVVEFAYFNEIWINTGLNGVDLSNYVTKDEMPKANNGEDTTSTLDTLKVDGVNYKLGGGEVDGTTIVKTSENKLQVVGMTNGTEEITASDIISALTIERL